MTEPLKAALIDFEGTVARDLHAKPTLGSVKSIKKLKELGYYIVVRSNVYQKTDVAAYLALHEIPVDEIQFLFGTPKDLIFSARAAGWRSWGVAMVDVEIETYRRPSS